ncbi:MAG: protein-L-isoaspartate(D-aspartate) O-methyltransferase [Sedimentisphaerales bacterium]|nr:protein-L-isoaspartate(D-aspartate) O-methyltransferase [Sedimentisphaerales bacterium]
MNYESAQNTIEYQRKKMVEQDLKTRGIGEAGVLSVMGRLPREEFVSAAYKSQAYADGPLPIGMGQTISQPYIVALMTQELRLNNFCEVLEVGTGSGYQTAILAKLSRRVYTIERFSELSAGAQAVLGRLKINNVDFYVGDGSCGWPFFADATKGGPAKRKFDRIVATAALPEIPQTLVDQLGEGGIIVAPVGQTGWQELIVGVKKEGKLNEQTICGVRFVKLIGAYSFEE